MKLILLFFVLLNLSMAGLNVYTIIELTSTMLNYAVVPINIFAAWYCAWVYTKID